jgi:hypothetical protein
MSTSAGASVAACDEVRQRWIGKPSAGTTGSRVQVLVTVASGSFSGLFVAFRFDFS